MRQGVPVEQEHAPRTALPAQARLHEAAVPDLDTDASDDGKGAVLWQKDADDKRRVISWFSKAWGQSMRDKPVYYRECEAMYWGLSKVKFHAQAAHLPLIVRIDQNALRWARHSTKGMVTKWRVELAGDMDYVVQYIPGETNVLADAASRYPMLGERTLTRIGLEDSFRRLLDLLPNAARDAKSAWLNAGKDTHNLCKILQAWRRPRNAIEQRRPSAANRK